MKAQIIKIGNSQGIRIPKLFLQESRISKSVEIEVWDNQIVIRSAKRPREEWEETFRLMAKNKDDTLHDDNLSQTRWDDEEWEW